ncbi:MAG: GTPase HflX [Candidatus Accumulibacter sp.]|jgi:GTP-binding protein HflX|nr:GTPase HflX [Accumulibacter sp.]
MSDFSGGGARALIVQQDFGNDDPREAVEEIRLLVESAGIAVCSVLQRTGRFIDPATFVGKGRLQEIAAEVLAFGADLVVFNHELSPAQERNLEKALQCRVIDRTTLILDIFAQRAQSSEGKLQVELAQLEHLSTRLVRGWTHLERQKGGIGLRGPGETQLETDRRLLTKRVKLLKERLVRLERQRAVQRRARTRGDVLNVSLVGYTNAGKSTLFNRLTHAGAYVADRLFATLDTTSRKLWLSDAGNIVVSDTVGFIRNLPHTLVAAFHSTLESVSRADLLLHVVDSTSGTRDFQIAEVEKVLKEIGAGALRQLIVLNKLDLTGLPPVLDRDEYGKIRRVRVSAKSGEGVSLLREALSEIAFEKRQNVNDRPPVGIF